MCNNWPDLPFDVQGATGGIIGNTVIICGGTFKECYSLTSEKATLVTSTSVKRFGAVSIVINDNTLWVTGGFSSGYRLTSTEYVTVTGTMPGPDLPIALSDHAMVEINSTFSMVIGGRYSNDFSALTFFYDRNEGEWITGPSLMQARGYHAAGIVTDEVTNENFVAVTGGYLNLDSTDILQDRVWVQGKMNDTIVCANS